MGVLRFILALLVMAAHLKFLPSFSLGIFATVIFMLISGYSMAYLQAKPSTHSSYWLYLSDRFLRLYPLYLFYLLITICLFVFFRVAIDLNSLFYNFFLPILNLGPNSIRDITLLTNLNTLIPQAWYLALLLQFYLVAPIIFSTKRRLVIALFFSLLIFTLGSYGLISAVDFNYLLLPGSLTIFLTGAIIYYFHHSNHLQKKSAYATLIKFLFSWSGFVFSSLFVVRLSQIFRQANKEILSGYILGIILVAVFGNKRSFHKIDTFLGELSYPLYLSHFIPIWFIEHSPIKIGILLQIAAAIILAIAGLYLVEKPLYAWRHRQR